MRRLALLAALAAAGLACASSALAATVYVRNVSAAVTDQELQAELPAYQAQVTLDFAPVWGQDASLVFVGHDAAPQDGMLLTIEDDSDVFGALGYHEMTAGHPTAHVFWQTSLSLDASPQVTLSHELLEMLADPFVHLNGDGGRFVKSGRRMYLVEVGDPVESEAYSYSRVGSDGRAVALSDFVTPAWYRGGSVGPYDFRGYARRPLRLLPDGYVSWMENGGWRQAFARRAHLPVTGSAFDGADGWSWGDDPG